MNPGSDQGRKWDPCDNSLKDMTGGDRRIWFLNMTAGEGSNSHKCDRLNALP